MTTTSQKSQTQETQALSPLDFLSKELQLDMREPLIDDAQINIKLSCLALLLKKYQEQFENKPTKKSKSKKGKLTPEEEVELKKNISAYTQIFPKVKIPTSGLAARSPEKEVFDTFIWFHANYPQYSWQTILLATDKYIREYEIKNWAYMATSYYFVRKQQPDKSYISKLANYCQQIVDDLDDNQGADHTRFHEKVV